MPPIIGITGARPGADRHSPPDTKEFRDYWDAVTAAGATPWMLGPSDEAALPGLLDGLDAIVFTGGEDLDPARYGEGPHPALGELDPARDRFEWACFQAAWADPELPILGICRGFQLMNAALGGTLWQDLPDQRDTIGHRNDDRPDQLAHPVRLRPGSRLAALLPSVGSVNSLHHQGLKDLAPGLQAVAWSPCGLIEAVEAVHAGDQPAPFRLGVQWHPEIPMAEGQGQGGAALFQALSEAAAARAARRAMAAGRR